MVQVPWFQVGTPFLVSTEVAASVADDIVEYQHYCRSRMVRQGSSPAPAEAEPQVSGPRTFLRRWHSGIHIPLQLAHEMSGFTSPGRLLMIRLL